MEATRLLTCETDVNAVLTVLWAEKAGVRAGIADVCRLMAEVLGFRRRYRTVARRLRRLEERGILRSDLVEGYADNSLVDAKGAVKVHRLSRVYRRVYTPNERSEEFRRLIGFLKAVCKEHLGVELEEALADSFLLTSLAEKLKGLISRSPDC